MTADRSAPPLARSDATGGLLFCAATRVELETLGQPDGSETLTGVGIPATLLALPPVLERLRPRGVVVTGIAGAYPGSGFGIGDVILGTSETFADLGMELPDAEGFRPVWKFPFAETWPAALPLHAPPALRALPGLRPGVGATVNMCAGTDATGALRRRVSGADFETMEGAAVALACRAAGVPVVQIRAVSNIAARRDMNPEGVARALQALTAFWSAHRDVVRAALSGSSAPAAVKDAEAP